MSVSEREIQKEVREHPDLVRKYGRGIAVQIALDHARRKKTTTPEGRREYMKNYMKLRREVPASAVMVIPSISDALGFRNEKRKRR